MPSGKLEMLEREALDTASHRFDAWVTSLATRRLDTVRKRRPTGAFVGGYGWVEDLAPSGSTRSDGYIQTPSMAQANTAAILASGYMAHRGQAGGNPFAIDLSSPRVKLAYRLIEGVRTGQPIGALLGYQLERELHDQNLSPFVAKFRALAPLASSPTAAEVSEAVAANNVVHGIRILDLWKNKDPKFQALRTLANLADFQKIDSVFAKMADQLDALGDVILADNMHQVAEGNFDRAAMTLSAVIAGQTIPEPDVLRTPRTGTAHSHCVLTLLNPAQAPVPAWPVDGMQARAAAEPALNAWAARMLGDPAKIRCRATYSAGANPLRVVKLSELKISPLDAIYSTSASGSTRTSEFEQRLTYLLLRTRPADVPADTTVTLDYSRGSAGHADIVSFDEFLAMTAALRSLLAKSRPLTASDLALPDRNVPPSIDAAELSARSNAAVTALKNANSRLKAALAAAGTPLEPVRTALVRLVYLGLSNGVPVSAVDGGPNDARLVSQGRSAFADITDRVKKLDDMAAAFSAANAKPEALLDFETRRLRTIFGPDFPVLPRFTLPQADEAAVAFGNSDALQRNRRIEAPSWFARAARVREGLGRLADVLRLAEVLGRDTPAWTVGQMPFVPGESWVALPLTSGTIPGGRLSLVAYGPLPAALNQPLAGMVFDEWTEVIPNRSETTGLAFHYDRPERAPAAIDFTRGRAGSEPAVESADARTDPARNVGTEQVPAGRSGRDDRAGSLPAGDLPADQCRWGNHRGGCARELARTTNAFDHDLAANGTEKPGGRHPGRLAGEDSRSAVAAGAAVAVQRVQSRRLRLSRCSEAGGRRGPAHAMLPGSAAGVRNRGRPAVRSGGSSARNHGGTRAVCAVQPCGFAPRRGCRPFLDAAAGCSRSGAGLWRGFTQAISGAAVDRGSGRGERPLRGGHGRTHDRRRACVLDFPRRSSRASRRTAGHGSRPGESARRGEELRRTGSSRSPASPAPTIRPGCRIAWNMRSR